MNKIPDSIPCRLCGAQADFIFSKPLMWEDEAKYFCCQNCKSLQSEQPTWLDRAYSSVTLASDISTLRRVAAAQRIVFWLSKIFKFERTDRILDWGGGNGMLVRHLRDLGLDAYVLDEYVKNAYAIGFDHKAGMDYRMITAFEVWEHFSQPDKDLDDLFKLKPEFIVITTGLYNGQGKEWEYVNPCGRHVFCYSEEGRQFVASKYGYQALVKGGFTLFSKNTLTFWQRLSIRFLFSPRIESLREALYDHLPKDRSLIEHDRKEARNVIYGQGIIDGANWP